MSLDQARAELAKLLHLAREEMQTSDPVAKLFASGRAAGLEDALD